MRPEILPRLPSKPTLKPFEENIIQRKKMDEASFRQIIRDLNLKVTDQRLLILASLYEGRAHVTAQEVFESVHTKDPSIGFATVYRFLRKLTESRVATEVRMGGQPARYELAQASHHHDHLSCVQCGKICEFENPMIESLQKQVAEELGFILTSHVLELYGLCSHCSGKPQL